VSVFTVLQVFQGKMQEVNGHDEEADSPAAMGSGVKGLKLSGVT
jgi:hypothetical protein